MKLPSQIKNPLGAWYFRRENEGMPGLFWKSATQLLLIRLQAR